MTKLAALACVLFLGCGGGGSHKPGPAQPGGGDTASASPPPPPVAPAAPAKPAGKASLYDRLGKTPALEAVVGDFLSRVAADPVIQDRFFNVDIGDLKRLLVEQICQATGGPCTYSGRDMQLTHAGLDISGDEFDALALDLVHALDAAKVPEKEKGELLGAIGGLKTQIVAPAEHFHPIDQAKLDQIASVTSQVQDKEAQRLLGAAITAGKRGQRSYAEQLFTRAEMIAGPKPLVKAAAVFRAGSPERVQTPTKVVKDAGPQPKVAGATDEKEVAAPKAVAKLHGVIKVDGKPPQGIGVVMLYPTKGAAAKRTPKQRVIEQRGREFAPHVTAVPVGSTVTFPNYDAVFHNVFSLSRTKSFDLGLYKNGEARDVKLDKAGVMRLGCNIHANMAAFIVVVDAPHYVVTGADGAYGFDGTLAPGRYRVSVWDEHGGDPIISEVDVKAGDNTQDFDLHAHELGLGTNKFGEPR